MKKTVGAMGFGVVGLHIKDVCRRDVITFRA